MGERGDAHWFTAGWNLGAMIAFVPAVVIGMMFVNTTLYVGLRD